MRIKIGIEVECILKGERAKELAGIIENIFRTERTISNADEYVPYYTDLKPFQEKLKEYNIKTEKDIYLLKSYLKNTYPSITMYFGRFINPLSKK